MVMAGGVFGTVPRLGMLILHHVHRRRRSLAMLSTVILTVVAFTAAYLVRFGYTFYPRPHTRITPATCVGCFSSS